MDELIRWMQRSFAEEPLRPKDPPEHRYNSLLEGENDQTEKVFYLARKLCELPQGERAALDMAILYVTEVLRHSATKPWTYGYFQQVLKERLFFDCRTRLANVGGEGTYLDSAEAARKFDEQYKRQPQGDEELCRRIGSDKQDMKCFHTAAAPILALLRRQAYGEVRGKVMLTAGTVLPA